MPAKSPNVDGGRLIETLAALQDHSDLETADFQYNVSVVHPKRVAYAKGLRIAKPDREEIIKNSFYEAALTEGAIKKGSENLSKHEHSVSMVLFIIRQHRLSCSQHHRTKRTIGYPRRLRPMIMTAFIPPDITRTHTGERMLFLNEIGT
ncbi:MAG: hypothetical protein OXC68_01965 [Aestuariivita sp.]|nr:hypothetical protein [Aestuariivita sp.]